jgi:hypothetical protein
MPEPAEPKLSDPIAARSALLDFYSDRAVAFGGFFIASIFGLLTVLTLSQGIKCADITWENVLVVLSMVVYVVFAYIGYYVLRGFTYYAKIADKLEGGGGGTGNLRSDAHLEKIIFDEQNPENSNLLKYLEDEDAKRKRMLGKIVSSNSILFGIAYVLLLFALAIVAYGPRFFPSI